MIEMLKNLLKTNRKLKLCLLVVLLSFLAFVLPPILFSKTLLTGGEWVAVVSLVVSAFFGANVAAKKVTTTPTTTPTKTDTSVKKSAVKEKDDDEKDE